MAVRIIICVVSIVMLSCGDTGQKPADTALKFPTSDIGAVEGNELKGSDSGSASCSDLTEDQCLDSPECMPLEGWSQPEACLVWNDDQGGGPARFAACTDKGECGAAFTWALAVGDASGVWLFPNTCIPDGWNISETPICVPGCPGSQCVVGEKTCAENAGAEVYCEDACLDLPDCPPCGKWGDTFYPCPNGEMCPEELGFCACPHTMCDWCCQSNEHVCDDSGGCCLPECHNNQCGDDGCGGNCGDCGPGFLCEDDGLCYPDDTPDCSGIECGPDGFGGSCGTCDEGFECSNGKCEAQGVAFCVAKCSVPSDCDPGGGGAFSADNYECKGGYCHYTGCISDAECVQTYSSQDYGCYGGDAYTVQVCLMKCSVNTDCDLGTPGAYSADNYECDEGHCVYIGCNTDAECAETFSNNNYGCHAGPQYVNPVCVMKCGAAADCDLGAGSAFSADNYNCVDGYCWYSGCKSDAECVQTFSSDAYGCSLP